MLDWFKEFQQVLEKKVAEENAAHQSGFVLEEKRAVPPQTAVPQDEAVAKCKREGKALRELLQGSNISEHDLAHQIGVSQTTVNRWINGYGEINYETIERSRYISLKLRKAIMCIRKDNAHLKIGKQIMCKKCGTVFVRYSKHTHYCSKCASDRRSAYNDFFRAYPQVQEYLQQWYKDLNAMLTQWSARGAPAPCIADRVKERYGNQIAETFIQAFNVRFFCYCSRPKQCKELFGKCKYIHKARG